MQPSKRSIERDPGYRKFYFKEDLKNATLALAFSIISISGFIVNDFLFFGYAPFFFALLSLRLGVIGVIGIAIYYIHKTQTPKMFDTLIFLVLIVELVSGGFVNMFRPPDFVAQAIVTIIFVCVFYLIIPYRFFYQCLFSTIATLGEIFIIVFVAHPSAVPVLFTVIFTLIITNVVAALGSWAMHSYRRRNYQEFLHRKQAQTRLQEHSDQLEKIVEERTQELKATERFAAIGATAGMVGHDLRNPLTGISNASYYLKKKYSQQIDDSGKEMLDIIQRNVEYSNKIINDLLEYSSDVNLDLDHKTNPHALMQDALSMLTVPPTVDVVDLTQTRPSLLVDPFRIRRVFLNILKNALDVMPDGGKLTLTSQQNGGMVRISFSDTGPGIPLEMQEKLFQPLFTTKAKGMGFGLAICQRIVEAHSGAISFQTALGQGTTFFIDLPHAERS